MLPLDTDTDSKTGFFFLLVKRNKLADYSEEDYRRYRSSVMHAYALNILSNRRDLERVVGIATEGELEAELRSEDMIYAEQMIWTKENEDYVRKLAEQHDIARSEIFSDRNAKKVRPLEYPPSHHKKYKRGSPVPYNFEASYNAGLNRSQRRAAKSRRRKNR